MDPTVFRAIVFMQQSSPAGIRDADHPEWKSLRLGSSSECNAAEFEVPLSEYVDLASPVRGWNADAPNCNAPSTI